MRNNNFRTTRTDRLTTRDETGISHAKILFDNLSYEGQDKFLSDTGYDNGRVNDANIRAHLIYLDIRKGIDSVEDDLMDILTDSSK